jgi:hypothetical protein
MITQRVWGKTQESLEKNPTEPGEKHGVGNYNLQLFPLWYLQIFLCKLLYSYIYIKSKGIYQPENLMSNGSSRHEYIYIHVYKSSVYRGPGWLNELGSWIT